MNTPLVTICIPTYRRFEYLTEAVASAQAQTYPHVEIVIGDDGDRAEIAHWSRQCAQSDLRVRYQKNGSRLGLAGNWNAVSQAAKGDFLAIIGDDDRLLPDFVARLMAARTAQSKVLFANHWLIDSAGHRLPEKTEIHNRIYGRETLPAGPLLDPVACVWSNSIPMSASLVHAQEVKTRGFRPDLNTPEIELFANMVAGGAEFVFVPDLLAEYRTHDGSASAAGLMSERLVKYLEPIEVPAKTEHVKRDFMQRLVLASVSRCLAEGRVEQARALLRSRYYPPLARSPLRVLAQRTSVRLPAALSKSVYEAGVRSVRGVRHVVARALSGGRR